MPNPFQMPGRWFRGNTHSHSTESDGRLPIAERFAAYRDRGYDFLVLTDHGKVNDVSEHSDETFLAISGSEVHPANPYGGDYYHIVAINIHSPIDFHSLHPNEVIAEIQGQGGLAVLCHPYWCGHTLLDYTPLTGYFAVEVYNDTCMGIGKGFAEEAWDNLLDATDEPVCGIAADDAHGTEHDCFHGWINVRAEELSTTAILDALRAGSFYSTMGPEILDIRIDPDADGRHRVSIACSPAKSISFLSQRSRGSRKLAPEGESLTGAEHLVSAGAKYVRVEVTDALGRKAWCNPFFF